MSHMTVTQARAKLYELVKKVGEDHEPLHIKGKHNSAVLISEEDWNAVQETLYLLSIKGMRESVRQGMDEPLDECATELDW